MKSQWRRLVAGVMGVGIYAALIGNTAAATISVTAPNVIATPDQGQAALYPSFITLQNYRGTITAVRVILHNMSHSYPDDWDILLVGPGGQKAILMSDCGGGFVINHCTLTLTDSGPPLPDNAQISTGTYRPTNYSDGNDALDRFPPNAAQAYSTSLAVFNNTSPNGTWNLYVVDDSSGDIGAINDGWTLELETTAFQNLGTITIPNTMTANPYPGVITVDNLPASITNVNLTLRQLTHSVPGNLDIMLTAPSGQNTIIMSDAGGAFGVNSVMLTFDDNAATSLPADSQIVAGTYKPTNIGDGDTFPAPAPTPTGSSMLSVFNGTDDPNGPWKLFIASDTTGGSGLLNGWQLDFTLEPTILANISTRALIGTGDNALIGGFIISGTQPKKVILRAIGPSLSLSGQLADPTLELRDASGTLIASNDNWRTDQEPEIIASMIPPTDDLESAIVATLPADNSAYTAIVRGANNTTGIGLVEIYDLDRTVDSKLANISTRGSVNPGDNALIAGTILTGGFSQKTLVRAIGPSLAVPNPLANPALDLRNASGASLASNDDWAMPDQAEILATTIPPTNSLESAIVANLPAVGASYTAIVGGVNNTSGTAVVEIYALSQ